jgi:hypothetical protein
MYSIRGNGDGIASEFSRLVGKAQGINKVAADADKASLPEGEIVDVSSASDEFENEIADLLVDDTSSENLADTSSSIENEINDMETYSSNNNDAKKVGSNSINPRGEYIMSGLGKISASLRNKGEGFAADVVEATAASIRSDLTKESNRKGNMLSVLNKMASDFSTSGDQFAADMVLATMNKIGN